MEYYNNLSEQPPKQLKFEEIFAFYYNLKGASSADEGKFDEAIKNFDKAIELNPELSSALFNRATIKADLGDLKGAREDFVRVREIELKHNANLYQNYVTTYFTKKNKGRINIF